MKSNNNNKKSLLLLYLLFMATAVSAQTQLGTDIDGEAAGDLFGFSISFSSDGGRMAVGALRNDGGGTDSGHVRVYQWLDSAWVQLGSDIDGESTDHNIGRSVSMSSDGNRLAIGASRGRGSGQVGVYHWSESSWLQLGANIEGESAGDGSGYSVSLSSDGSRLAIGAPYSDENGSRSGYVRAYEWSGSAWVQLGGKIHGEATDDRSGISVSLSSDGSVLAIGAPGNDGSGDRSGHVRVYRWTGSTWAQLGTDIDGEGAGDNSGYSVSLSSDGSRLAIGAYENGSIVAVSNQVSAYQGKSTPASANQKDAGHVRVYQWSGTAWEQLGADIDGEAANDYSGDHVSLSSDGNRVAIGAIGNSDNGFGSGHARVYQWTGSTWVQLGIDIDGEAAGDYSGHLAISPNGKRLAIGAPHNDGNGGDSGHVRVYDLSMFDAFSINPGLNDAWANPLTDGQGFFITVFPDLGYLSLAWFTYDTVLPPLDATANLGDPGHRWITAVGPYHENKAILDIEMTSGGLFDTAAEITRTDPPGTDGTITVIFDDCNSGSVEYDIPSIDQRGVVPIQRVANDNIVLCQILGEKL